MSPIASQLIEIGKQLSETSSFLKTAFQPAPPPPPSMQQQQAMAQGGQPPMDPAMAQGGQPPMDPAMAQGGQPPMDPAMAQGGQPPMDPQMAAAMQGSGQATNPEQLLLEVVNAVEALVGHVEQLKNRQQAFEMQTTQELRKLAKDAAKSQAEVSLLLKLLKDAPASPPMV